MTTIAEIAERAGVSTAAAARALSYDPALSISDEVRRRIFEAAASPECRSSLSRGREERGRRACRIGLFDWTPAGADEDRADGWRSAVRRGVERACEIWAIECAALPNPAYGPSSWPEELDGLIAVGRIGRSELARLPAYAGPMVIVGSSPDDRRCDSVVIDYAEAMERLIGHWTGLGFRRFVYIGTCGATLKAHAEEDRLSAFRRGLARRGLDRLHLCPARTATEDEARRLMAEALRRLGEPAAFLIENRALAAGASAAAKQAGLRIPEDVRLAVLDDGGLQTGWRGPFAALHAPWAFMGVTAVKQLADRVRTNRELTQKTVLRAALVI